MGDSGLIKFHFPAKAPWLKNRSLLKRFSLSIFKSEKKKVVKLDVIFCTDRYLLTLNQQFLKHNTYTDVVTFDLSEPLAGITGEIYISLERIKENANTYHCSPSQELHRVLFHGILHLCGYNDKKEPEKEQMRDKENLYLRNFSAFLNKQLRST